MKINKIILIFAGIIIIANLALYITTSQKSLKIAYVKSHELIYGYLGMKEAQNKYQMNSQIWKANVDTLQFDYQRTFNKYRAEYDQLSEKEKAEREEILKKLYDDVINYSKAIETKAKGEEDKILEGVLNQVNSFVEEYGKTKGYDVIFGTTLSGSSLDGDMLIFTTGKLQIESLIRHLEALQLENVNI